MQRVDDQSRRKLGVEQGALGGHGLAGMGHAHDLRDGRGPQGDGNRGGGVTGGVAPLRVAVACHAGYRGEETPRRFEIGDRSVEVTEVLDRWLAPEHRYFKLRGSDGATYVLRHDVVAETWEIVLYTDDPRL